MRTIVVDDDSFMLEVFKRFSKDIKNLNLVGSFTSAEEAIAYSMDHPIELAFLDIELPHMNGIECAEKLRENSPKLLIVFISAHENYVHEFNMVAGDDYIVKPYSKKVLESTMEKMRLLVKRQEKDIYVQMFGEFTVYKDGAPLPLRGKAKEILALIMVKRGKEISNEKIYTTIWETREYSNKHMKVYYNALKRLKTTLETYGLSELILSTTRGQIANISLFDCDYYSWQDKNPGTEDRFEGEFLSEYSWGEYILGTIINNYDQD